MIQWCQKANDMNHGDTKSLCARKLELNLFNINGSFYITSPQPRLFFVHFAAVCFVAWEDMFFYWWGLNLYPLLNSVSTLPPYDGADVGFWSVAISFSLQDVYYNHIKDICIMVNIDRAFAQHPRTSKSMHTYKEKCEIIWCGMVLVQSCKCYALQLQYISINTAELSKRTAGHCVSIQVKFLPHSFPSYTNPYPSSSSYTTLRLGHKYKAQIEWIIPLSLHNTQNLLIWRYKSQPVWQQFDIGQSCSSPE